MHGSEGANCSPVLARPAKAEMSSWPARVARCRQFALFAAGRVGAVQIAIVVVHARRFVVFFHFEDDGHRRCEEGEGDTAEFGGQMSGAMTAHRTGLNVLMGMAVGHLYVHVLNHQ